MGYIDWWEFEPQKDTFIVECKPDNTKKETETGIIFSTEDSIVQDRPSKGKIINCGKDSKFSKGDFVYFEPNKGMDLKMIRTSDDETYLLLYDDAIIGKKVEDIRA